MKALKAALQFITILPVGKHKEYLPDAMPALFPVAGLIIGFFLASTDLLAGTLWGNATRSVVDVVFLVVVTGAFHLDGLADAADGLFSHRSKDRMLEIMKDSRTGVMGVVVLICCLGLKWGGIYAFSDAFGSASIQRFILLMIIPAYARSGMIFGIRLFNYGRPDGGTAFDFFSQPHTPLQSMAALKSELPWYKWLLLPVILSVFTGKGIVINLLFPIIIIAILYYYKRMLNCITGDMLGAMTEITETLLLVILATL